MITHRPLNGRTVLVIAVAAFVVAVAPRAMAQSARGGPPWWAALPIPSDEAQSVLLQNAQRVAASSFDPMLPPIPIDAWLFVTLAPRVEVLRSRLVEWRLDFCGGYARGANPPIVTATGPGLCAKARVEVSADRNLHLVFLVANAVRDPLEWVPASPALKEVYIERVEERFTQLDTLDVPELSGLVDLLQTPFDQWPRVDLESEITWDPPMPSPGETVRVSISVRNTGKRAADRAWVDILISPCCDRQLEVRRDWFPYLAPGQTARADFTVPLPEGRALARVGVRLGPSTKKVLERRQEMDKRPTEAAIGLPLRTARQTLRFEVRLAESRMAAGLREVRVVGSNHLVYLHQDVVVSDADVSRGRVVPGDGPAHFGVAVDFTPSGAEKMRQATSRHLGGPLALLVNGDLVAAPRCRGTDELLGRDRR
ncbi:MAG: CARDB domain-containing protein [Vicinamibacterales bacterium]